MISFRQYFWMMSLIVLLGNPIYGQDRYKKDIQRFWVIKFNLKEIKRFQFEFSNYVVRKGYVGRKIRKATVPSEYQQTEVYWYMLYTLTVSEYNYSQKQMVVGKSVPAFIDIVAESRSFEASRIPSSDYPKRPERVIKYHDTYHPLVKKALELQYKRKFWGQADLTISTNQTVERNRVKKGRMTRLNLPTLGGVDSKRPAILNFRDGNHMRGKITSLSSEKIYLSEFKDAWNMIPFVRTAIRNKEKIRRATIIKTSSAGGEEIECTIVDLSRDEIVYKRMDEEDTVSLDQVREVRLEIPKGKVESISYECVAIFQQWDKHMDFLKIKVKGLSNGILYNAGRNKLPIWSRAEALLNQSEARQEADYLSKIIDRNDEKKVSKKMQILKDLVKIYENLGTHDRVLRYTVYEMKYERPGDEFYVTLDKLIFRSKSWKTYAKVIKIEVAGKESE